MRIPKSSKLDAHRDLLFRLWKDGKTVAAIGRVLKGKGHSATNTTISQWYDWKVESGELPPRLQLGIEKPAIPEKSPGTTIARPIENRSLGLLDASNDDEQQARMRRILQILFKPEIAGDATAVSRMLGPHGCDIPFNDEGDPDFGAYARRIGKRRVSTYGDMDFVLLAMWTRKFRTILTSPQADFPRADRPRALIDLARKLRGAMYAAVGLRTP